MSSFVLFFERRKTTTTTTEKMQALRRVAIVSATRTPIGAFGGSLKALKNHDLAAVAIKDVCAFFFVVVVEDFVLLLL